MRDCNSEQSRNPKSDKKIDKNVKIVEIDHSGAYLCGHELSEIVYLYVPGLKVLWNDRKLALINPLQKFHFVLCFSKSLFTCIHIGPSKLAHLLLKKICSEFNYHNNLLINLWYVDNNVQQSTQRINDFNVGDVDYIIDVLEHFAVNRSNGNCWQTNKPTRDKSHFLFSI